MELRIPSEYSFIRGKQYFPAEIERLVQKNEEEFIRASCFSYRFRLEFPDICWYYGVFFSASGKGIFKIQNILSWRPSVALESFVLPPRMLSLSKLEITVQNTGIISINPTIG
jgi:hypothetical protein